MDVAERFGASIDVAKTNPDETAFYLVKRDPSVAHDRFMRTLLSVVGTDRLLFHHRDGLAVVLISQATAEWLKTQSMCALVGGVHVDAERLQAMLGFPSPRAGAPSGG